MKLELREELNTGLDIIERDAQPLINFLRKEGQDFLGNIRLHMACARSLHEIRENTGTFGYYITMRSSKFFGFNKKEILSLHFNLAYEIINSNLFPSNPYIELVLLKEGKSYFEQKRVFKRIKEEAIAFGEAVLKDLNIKMKLHFSSRDLE